MQVYEFYAEPKNGMIQIPEEYKNHIKDNVIVIVKKIAILSPPSLKTKGWKFDRDMTNER